MYHSVHSAILRHAHVRKDAGSPRFSVLQTTEGWVRPGNEAMYHSVHSAVLRHAHVRKDAGSPRFSVLQTTESWVGPGNEAMYHSVHSAVFTGTSVKGEVHASLVQCTMYMYEHDACTYDAVQTLPLTVPQHFEL